MIKNLLKAVTEYRVETKEDADALHKQFEDEARTGGYTLTAWTETFKETKVKGEVIETYYVCKATFVFDNAKTPINNFDGVEFTEYNNVSPF